MTEQQAAGEQPVEITKTETCAEVKEQEQPAAELPAENLQQQQDVVAEEQKEETNKEPSLEQQN